MEMFDPLIQQFRRTGIDQTSFAFLNLIGQNGQEFFRRFKSNTVQQGTLIATTSGTIATFTLPPFLKWIVFSLNGVSTNGTTDYLLRVGTGGTLASTGYQSRSAILAAAGITMSTNTTGFVVADPADATHTYSGQVILNRHDESTFIWNATHSIQRDNSAALQNGAGTVTLTGNIDTIALTTVGPDTLDAGSVNWIGG